MVSNPFPLNPFNVFDKNHVRIKNTPTVGKVTEVLSDDEVAVVFPTGACARIKVDRLELVSARLLDNPIQPNYYKLEEPISECTELINKLDLNFNLGNAIKYLWRAGRKTPDRLEDLKKAKQYLEFEIARSETR